MNVEDYYRYAVLATASYVRLGADLTSTSGSVNSATFVQRANTQDRLPTIQGNALFNPTDRNAAHWDVLSYYRGGHTCKH